LYLAAGYPTGGEDLQPVRKRLRASVPDKLWR